MANDKEGTIGVKQYEVCERDYYYPKIKWRKTIVIDVVSSLIRIHIWVVIFREWDKNTCEFFLSFDLFSFREKYNNIKI